MPDSPEIKAALFDLDDTLIDRHGAYDLFYRAFYDRNDAINESISWPEAREFFWSLSPDNATDPHRAFEVIKQRWPSVDGDPDSHYHNYFQGIVENMKPLPGAVDFIEALNMSGMPWGVVTNGDKYQLEKVKAVGLEDEIPFVIATKLHGPNKPAPEPYRKAVEMLGLDESDCKGILFVGDNPHTDIAGAHGLGMQTAWIHMGRQFPPSMKQPDMTISEVGELVEVLGLDEI